MDNFFAAMFRPRVQHRDETATSQSEGTQTETSSSASASFEDRRVTVYSEQKALVIGAYYRALAFRAHAFGQLIPEYQRCDRANGGNFVLDNYGSAGKLNWKLQVRPNPLMTGVKLLENLELQRIQHGNGVAYLERNFMGDVANIWLCSYAELDIVTNTYNITYNAVGGQKSRTVPASDIIHLRNVFTYDDGLTGIPTLEYMRDALTLDATNMKLQTDNAAKGGKTRLLLTQGEQKTLGTGKLKKSQMKSAKDELQESISQGGDVHTVPYGTTVTPISMTATEMDILNSRHFTVEEVSRFTGVAKIFLGDGSNSSYKTYMDALTDFYRFTAQPCVREFEDEANFKILNENDWGRHRIHLCERDLMRLDPTAQATLNEKLLGIGVKTINEIRREYDQPSIEGGDDAFVTVQAQKVKDLGKKEPAETVTPNDGHEAGKGE